MSENQKIPGVLSEVELLEALNIEKPTLDKLRTESGFPCARLDQRNRAYIIADVLDWLKRHTRT